MYEKVKEETCTRLYYHNYPRWTLNRACNIVDRIPCSDLFKQRMTCKSHAKPALTFITTFSPQYNDIVKIVMKHMSILNYDPKLRCILNDGVKFISNRAPTIGKQLLRVKAERIIIGY